MNLINATFKCPKCDHITVREVTDGAKYNLHCNLCESLLVLQSQVSEDLLIEDQANKLSKLADKVQGESLGSFEPMTPRL